MKNEALNDIYEHLIDRDLSGAFVAMDAYLSARAPGNDMLRFEAIRSDFQLMTDYWKRGYKDPQLQALYDNLLRRMYVLYANVALGNAVGKSSFLSSVYTRLTVTARDWSVQALREDLESHVSELAMLELEPKHLQEEKRKAIFRRHHQLLSEWFDNVWLSTIWTEGQASTMEELLLSPTIDSNDQQLLVSGITLAVINYFDIAKFRTLLHVYQKSQDVYVRQRALVGWVLSLKGDLPKRFYREELKEMEKLLEDKAVCEELMQLQQQIIFCINAEKDNQTIQKEIMPDLLKNSNIRVTRNGIEEVEDDPLEDILHPDAADRRMEQLEQSYQRMLTMQQQGSDIYFGGFSQMKRYPFFQEICNWFVPFYTEHPGIEAVVSRFNNNRFLDAVMRKGPFCNSDNYSFLLAFGQVMQNLPQAVREAMESNADLISEGMANDKPEAPYIRRSYLQDLYRFYRLYPYRSEFRDPFDRREQDYILFAFPVFSKTHLEPHFMDMAAFLIKHQLMYEAAMILENCGEARHDFRYYMTGGYLTQHGYYEFADEARTDLYFYQKALDLQPENERALSGLARALFNRERYQEALDCYEQLLQKQPEKKSHLLNRAVCLSRLSRYADALKDLYKLNYEQSDDRIVNRVLAWVLACDDKYEQAEKIYNQLLTDNPTNEDILNYGYCLWFAGHVDEAADCFHRYLKESDDKPFDILSREQKLLMEKGITEPEMQMMLYLL